MKKTARLDKIFLKMGSVTEEQIARALARQKSYGGRLGENLIELGAIDERQLLAALSQQFRIPLATPGEADIAIDILKRLPDGAVLEDRILPLAWDETQKILTLAVGDPGAQAAMIRVKEALEAEKVRIVLASERLITNLGLSLLSGEGRDPEGVDGPRIELPELFEQEEGEEHREAEGREGEAEELILMVSGGASLKNFLPPIFLREGRSLTVTSSAPEAAETMGKEELDGILVAQEMAEEFSGWIRNGQVPEPQVDVTVFPSVSQTLLSNPVSYESMVRSLRAAVQALADFRCAHFGSCPPYGLIVHDLEYLGHSHRLSRVARDGMHLAAHLLLPTECEYAPDPVGSAEPFHAFSSSLELATRIRFPWRLDAVLDACHALFSGRATPESDDRWPREVHRAAQLMAMVWYRHNHIRIDGRDEEEAMIALRTNLRTKAGTLASLEAIEGYLGWIQERGGAAGAGGPRQVLLVGRERISRALSQELSRLGVQVIETDDLADAQGMVERSPPGAVVIDHTEFPEEVGRFVRLVRLEGSVPLFVLTDSTDPTLVLNLLDIGANDVFGPTHEFDLMAARLNHAIRNQTRQAANGRRAPGQFSATFEVFSFLDLIQTLGHGFKSVRIDLARSDGEEATLFMEKGRLVHGTAGPHSGAEAVYQVIAWEDDGEFTVHQETDFPEATIQASTESLLMEGCRLLDEARR
jgi:CheY-like chemotaxis protein